MQGDNVRIEHSIEHDIAGPDGCSAARMQMEVHHGLQGRLSGRCQDMTVSVTDDL
jgi:hypothetical protein